jgi:hypothetical protein
LQRFLAEGAIGSHLEILERRGGFKGFNQKSVSAIIAATDRANNRSSMPEPYGVKTPSHSSEPHCSPLLLHTHEGESELLRGVESRDRLIYPRR